MSFSLLLYALQNVDKDRTSQEVVELIQEHPQGIPLKKLAVFYSFRYKRNLTVSNLGFDSIASFVESLSKDLLVENESVFHKLHRLTPAAPAPLNETPPAIKNSSGICFGAASVQNKGEMTQEELLEKVKEVIRIYPAAATSITQLTNGYFLLFGSILPLGLYMSLYDNQTSTQQATFGQAQVIAQQEEGSPASTYCQHNFDDFWHSNNAEWRNCKSDLICMCLVGV